LVRIAQEGHEVGNHTWSHRQLTNLSEREILDQIMTTRAKIYDVTGQDCLTVRPPYGAFNDTVQAVGDAIGVSFINWSVDTLDWKSRDPQAVYEEVLSHAANGAIILCHDLHSSTVDAMELVIPKLLDEGYQLVTVTQLLEYKGDSLEAGKMYYEQT
jgi:peptidoglycan/xylan/chitin deacetylase (PgdA/CDA1 family)